MAIELSPSITLFLREDWGARKPEQKRLVFQGWDADEAFLHHTADRPRYEDLEDQKRVMRGYQDFHMDVRGWADLAYHFVVFEGFETQAGTEIPPRVFQGRERQYVPAAQERHNTGTLAVCVVGNYERDFFHESTRYAIEVLLNRYDSLRTLGAHRDVVNTTCPGKNAVAQIQRIADVCGLKRYEP